MSGTYNGMQVELKKHWKHTDYCPCAAHSLSSVGEFAISCCTESANLFIIIELHNFF